MTAHNTSIRPQTEWQNIEHSVTRLGSKLKLSKSLLVTTDLESLLKGFAAEIRALVPSEGIEFVNHERGIMFRAGEIRRHSCCYTLKIRDWVAGKMKFTRGRRFNMDELTVLESVLAELLFPLRRALLYWDAPERRSGRGHGATVGSHQRREDSTTTAAPSGENSAVAPKTPRLPEAKTGSLFAHSEEAPTCTQRLDEVQQIVGPCVCQDSISRRIDWYVKSRGLPTLIVDFLDTHWRSYTLQCFVKDGEESARYREATVAMKELAWSVHPKKESLSRRRHLALIPNLYHRLRTGLESLGLGPGTTEHDAFFAELAKLHQAALDLQTPMAEVA